MTPEIAPGMASDIASGIAAMIANALNMTAPLADLMTRAGFIGWVLLAMSVLALALVLLKLFQFHYTHITATAASDEALREIQRGDVDAAMKRLAGRHHPAAKVLLAALEHRDDAGKPMPGLEDELQRVGERELDRIEWGFRPLAAVAQLSPLLGLLGTVVGMIRAFAELEAAGEAVSPSLLAGGIWEALLTTAMGLAIAIPVRAVLYYLEARADHAAAAMQHTATRALHALGVRSRDSRETAAGAATIVQRNEGG
ncbi:MAG: MotA/TolQ/ExbB proton channel family protein [Rhodospirillales bacterium]|nr:MotA/TolQ/ExbB proton channel family protein [Rhodospirillales bacterium]